MQAQRIDDIDAGCFSARALHASVSRTGPPSTRKAPSPLRPNRVCNLANTLRRERMKHTVHACSGSRAAAAGAETALAKKPLRQPQDPTVKWLASFNAKLLASFKERQILAFFSEKRQILASFNAKYWRSSPSNAKCWRL